MGSTIYDVSKRSGLSIATVSRVVNGKGGVSPESERKIREAIADLNYEPNASAQGLALNCSRTIGLVLDRFNDQELSADYTVRFIDGVSKVAGSHDFDVLLIRSSNRMGYESIKARQKFDGLLMAYIGQSSELLLQDLVSKNFPIVYTGTRRPYDQKGLNVYGGFRHYRREALDRLYQAGCRKIAYFEDVKIESDSALSARNSPVVQEFINAHGGDSELCKIYTYDTNNLRQVMSTVQELFAGNKLDSIFTTSEVPCQYIYAAIYSAGLRIPEDVKIISATHNEVSGTFYHPPLTAMFVDAYNMGRKAAEKLIKLITEGSGAEVCEDNVPYKYIERNSL